MKPFVARRGEVLLVIAGIRKHRFVLPEIRIETGVCGKLAPQARDHALSRFDGVCQGVENRDEFLQANKIN